MLTSATNLSAEDGDFLVDFADCKNPGCNTPACYNPWFQQLLNVRPSAVTTPDRKNSWTQERLVVRLWMSEPLNVRPQVVRTPGCKTPVYKKSWL